MLLALLLGIGALVLYRMPVRRYAVTCERTTRLACVLEQVRSSDTRRTSVTLGTNASAVVRIVPGRRGTVRVFLYLETPSNAVFAAEFEGGDAGENATAAATRLNQVLRSAAPAVAHVEAVPPPLYRRMAWSTLGVMGLLTLAAHRETRRRAPVA